MEVKKETPSAFFEKLQQDIEVMRVRYPQFKLKYKDKQYFWEGKVKIKLGFPYFLREHLIKVKMNSDYPSSDPIKAPLAYVDINFHRKPRSKFQKHNPKFIRPPHLYTKKDDALCLFYPEALPSHRWTSEDTIDVIVTWSILWLYAYYIWLQHGKKNNDWEAWPEPDVKHVGRK